jgi:hypothetical protein
LKSCNFVSFVKINAQAFSKAVPLKYVMIRDLLSPNQTNHLHLATRERESLFSSHVLEASKQSLKQILENQSAEHCMDSIDKKTFYDGDFDDTVKGFSEYCTMSSKK